MSLQEVRNLIIKERKLYSDYDIRIQIGNLIFNVMNINFEPPRKGWEVKNHCHSSYELHYIPQGKGTLRINEKLYEINPGSFYLTGPGVHHEQISDEEDPMSECCINFEFSIKDKKNIKDNFYSEAEVDCIIQVLKQTKFWFGNDGFNTVQLFEKIKYEFEHEALGCFSNIQSLVTQIIINAVRHFSGEKEHEIPIPQKTLYEKRRFIIDSYFREYYKPLSIEEVAKAMEVSTRQLDRIMKEYFSMSFIEMLTRRRIEHAKDYLLNTKLSLESISEAVGFSSAAHFSKIFKQYEQCTPSLYRKQKKSLS
jgi:AraC-like DNA-binding protein/quercetin dioxygenase-like cupin family protein